MCAAPLGATASAEQIGQTTGLRIPRFVSLKTRPANVRIGPGIDYPIKWTFVRRNLPVEITAESGQWRRIRDWEGTEGWILGALLSGKRTALVSPWSGAKREPLRANAKAGARIVAFIQPKVLVRIEGCDGEWCEVWVRTHQGFIRQASLWGAYPGEEI